SRPGGCGGLGRGSGRGSRAFSILGGGTPSRHLATGHQLLPSACPSEGRLALYQVVGVMLDVTDRTDPSHSATWIETPLYEFGRSHNAFCGGWVVNTGAEVVARYEGPLQRPPFGHATLSIVPYHGFHV